MKKHAITASIESLDDQIRDMRRKQRALRGHREHINARLAPLLAAHDKGWLNATPQVYAAVNYYDDRTSFEIYAGLHNVDGFKHEVLMDILTAYIDASKVKTTDYPEHRQRAYTFTFDAMPNRPEITVMLDVIVKSDSPTCQRVLTKVVDVVRKMEVYEMVCND